MDLKSWRAKTEIVCGTGVEGRDAVRSPYELGFGEAYLSTCAPGTSPSATPSMVLGLVAPKAELDRHKAFPRSETSRNR